MSLSFCSNKYVHMAFFEKLKRDYPNHDDDWLDYLADKKMVDLDNVPTDIFSRAIELAAIEKPRGNICRWTEKIDELGFRTFVSHCEHSYRNKGEAEFCPGCGRRIEIAEGDAELKLLKTAPNTDFNLTRNSSSSQVKS